MARGKPVEGADKLLCQISHPTYCGKEGTLTEWWQCVQAQTYQPRSTFVVDNTRFGPGVYLKTLQDMGIDAIHLQPWVDKSMEVTFKRCWELIAEHARETGAFWVLSLEADNIIAPTALDTMIKLAAHGNCHLVTHSYPMHQKAAEASGMKGDEYIYEADMGVMLMTRQLLERGLELFDEFKKLSVAIFNANERYRGGHVRLTNCFESRHLDCWSQEFPQFETFDPDEPSICPTPEFPADFGTVLPPSLEKYVNAKQGV